MPWQQTNQNAQQSVTVALDFLIIMDDSRFGFSSFAEQWNGRLAMLGFVIGLGTELLTGQGILSQVGLGWNLLLRQTTGCLIAELDIFSSFISHHSFPYLVSEET